MKIFITGATGFLGKYLVEELSADFEVIYVLTRNTDFCGFNHHKNVKLIKGDITNLAIVDNSEDFEDIISECDYVVHAAALYDMSAGHADSYLQNIVGTQNTLRLIKKMKHCKAFYYLSTIAVGDDDAYFLEEDHLPERKKFSSFYAETKYHAEKMVREADLKTPKRIIRPGILIGDSVTGEMPKIDGPYYFISALKKFKHVLKALPFIPLSFNPRTKLPIIPVDHCARYIALLIKRDDGLNLTKTYHLISDEIPSLKEFLDDLNESLGLKLQYIPVMKNPLHKNILNLLGIPKELMPFMFSKLSYDKTRTHNELPELKMSLYSAYKNKLFREL